MFTIKMYRTKKKGAVVHHGGTRVWGKGTQHSQNFVQRSKYCPATRWSGDQMSSAGSGGETGVCTIPFSVCIIHTKNGCEVNTNRDGG